MKKVMPYSPIGLTLVANIATFLLDIFPVLGVGTVLIPWGISSLITGNYVLGIEILILYLIIVIATKIKL